MGGPCMYEGLKKAREDKYFLDNTLYTCLILCPSMNIAIK